MSLMIKGVGRGWSMGADRTSTIKSAAKLICVKLFFKNQGKVQLRKKTQK